MFENLKVGQKAVVQLGVATIISGIVAEVSDAWVTFVGDITVYGSDGWKVLAQPEVAENE